MNKLKRIILVLALLIIPTIALVGCSPKSSNYTTQEQTRFILISEYICEGGDNYEIIVDKETKIIYIKLRNGYQGGITALLDENGNPQKYDGDL